MTSPTSYSTVEVLQSGTMTARVEKNTRRSCDRCYAMKEKCAFLAGATSCSRCLQVRRQCTTARPIRPAGRKPRTRRALQTSSPSFSEALVMTPPRSSLLHENAQELHDGHPGVEAQIDAILNSDTFEPFEEQLIRMLQPEREADLREFSSILVTCPKFEQDLILRLRTLMNYNIDGHVDGYLACMGALALKLGFIEDDDNKSVSNIRRGALAVAKLRSSVGPQGFAELDAWITFGLAIVTFAMTALGTAATTVRRHIIKHVASQPIIPNELQYGDSFVPMLVFETWECILKRSIPVYKLDLNLGSPPVDRLFGLATSLLPTYYELCRLSCDISSDPKVPSLDAKSTSTSIRQEIERWQPCIPANFTSDYTTTEVVHLLAQAELHRKAALLFLHGLCHPFGEEDVRAERLAREIMSEIERAHIVTGSRVLCIAFPFFIAGVNARDCEMRDKILARAKDHMDPTCPLVSKQCEEFLQCLWQIRDASKGFFWLDLLKHLPEIIMPI